MIVWILATSLSVGCSYILKVCQQGFISHAHHPLTVAINLFQDSWWALPITTFAHFSWFYKLTCLLLHHIRICSLFPCNSQNRKYNLKISVQKTKITAFQSKHSVQTKIVLGDRLWVLNIWMWSYLYGGHIRTRLPVFNRDIVQ